MDLNLSMLGVGLGTRGGTASFGIIGRTFEKSVVQKGLISTVLVESVEVSRKDLSLRSGVFNAIA